MMGDPRKLTPFGNRKHQQQDLTQHPHKLKTDTYSGLGPLMRRVKSLKKTLMLGKTEGRRRRGQQSITRWMASSTQRT